MKRCQIEKSFLVAYGQIGQPQLGDSVLSLKLDHTSIKHSITPWNRTVCFYSQSNYWTKYTI